MVFAEFEGDAGYLLKRAGLDPDEPPNVRTLVTRLLGAPPRLAKMRGEAVLSRVGDDMRIFVRSGTSPARAKWLAAHELAHWWLRESGQEQREIVEMQADVLGAILVVPGRVVTRAYRLHGPDPIRIADTLKTTQSLALLRLGETNLVPSALVEVHRSLLRGEAYRWPSKATLRRALRQDLDGLRRVVITDEPRRVGLLVP